MTQSFVTLIYISSILFITSTQLSYSFQQVKSYQTSTFILGNVTDLLVDVGEELMLDCGHDEELSLSDVEKDGNHKANEKENKNKNLSYEWFRTEDNWFEKHQPVEKLFHKDKKLLVVENRATTVLYKCITKDFAGNSFSVKSYRLYADRMPKKKREAFTPSCYPPKCKPYASVIQAHCDTVELNITYPHSQHGYNRSTSIWGNILCNDEIGGFQVWVVGHGILKRFLPRDMILIENLKPGVSYCFNGWAYNSCGSGPVFTLEGVCAVNDEHCTVQSKEHCELDFEDAMLDY